MIEYLSNPVFWVGLGQIIIVNIVLSGDNAVVIALAARSLPPNQQKQAIIWGSVAAIVMRVILTIVAVEMLKLPYLEADRGLVAVLDRGATAGARGRRRRRHQEQRQPVDGDPDHPDRGPCHEPR
jgi:predicted tellurium resistance membrane protein TerC